MRTGIGLRESNQHSIAVESAVRPGRPDEDIFLLSLYDDEYAAVASHLGTTFELRICFILFHIPQIYTKYLTFALLNIIIL